MSLRCEEVTRPAWVCKFPTPHLPGLAFRLARTPSLVLGDFEGLPLLRPKNTCGPLPCLPFRRCRWFLLLVVEGREKPPPVAGPTATLLPFVGDVGSFMIKLVEGLQGQTWSSDWVEELRKADQQKEQTYRSVRVEWIQQG